MLQELVDKFFQEDITEPPVFIKAYSELKQQIMIEAFMIKEPFLTIYTLGLMAFIYYKQPLMREEELIKKIEWLSYILELYLTPEIRN